MRTAMGIWALAALAMACPAAAAEAESGAWRPQAVWVTGTDLTAWIVAQGAPRPTGLPIVRCFYGDALSERVFASPAIPDRFGVVTGVATTRDGLVILYADGSLQRVTLGATASLPRWPDRVAPLAWCGDPTRSDVYAVGEGAALDLPSTAPATRASSPRRPALTPATRPASGRLLLRLRHRSWQIVKRLPEEPQSAPLLRLAAREGRVYLCWHSGDHRPIGFTAFDGERWSAAMIVPQTEKTAEFHVAADRIGPVLATADARGLRVHWRKDAQWFASQPLRDARRTIETGAGGVSIAVARKKLVLARYSPDGRIEFGESALDGDRTVQWQNPLAPEAPTVLVESDERQSWLEMFVIVAMMSLVVWRRHDSLVRPLALPQTLAVAPVGRRLVALVVDLVPAALVTLPLWIGPVEEAMLIAPHVEGRLGQALLANMMAWPTLAMLACHALYCLIWEALSGTTPGKRLLGCRVTTETGAAPSFRQVAIRSAMRLPELGMLLVTIATFFMMTMISRKMQRIGDVLAGTLVVCDRPPTARPLRPESSKHEEVGVGESDDERFT